MKTDTRARFIALALTVLLVPASAFSQSVIGVLGIASEIAGQALKSYEQFVAPASENAAALAMAVIARLGSSASR